jgi:hypothetical protein
MADRKAHPAALDDGTSRVALFGLPTIARFIPRLSNMLWSPDKARPDQM